MKWLNIFAPSYSSFLGRVGSKREALEQYKFSICYENARDIPGYVTEKIFDCFLAGCIPIYWGANDIADFVPAECFIDKRKFETYQDLYVFLDTMSDEMYFEYVANIDNFLRSQQILQFSSQYFADVLIKHCKAKSDKI